MLRGDVTHIRIIGQTDTKRDQRCRLRPSEENSAEPSLPRNSGERKECLSQLSSKRQLPRVLPPFHITY